MCLILLGYRAHPRYRLVLAANRDELHGRPTAAASFWADAPGVLAGRDLVQGGTWLGVTRRGRVAAVTNLRDGRPYRSDAPSRGNLAARFLVGSEPAERFLDEVRGRRDHFNGFNLLVGDTDGLYLYSSGSGEPVRLTAGIHAVSNHTPGNPWPKTLRGRALLQRALSTSFREDDLLALLADDLAPHRAAEDVHEVHERGASPSPIFIRGASFGTRSSTVLLVGEDGAATFVERTFGRDGENLATARFLFTIAA